MRVKAAAQESVASSAAVVAPTVSGVADSSAASGEDMADEISKVPALAKLGRVIKSGTKVVELTESETEYVVGVRKHIFANHFVFQVWAGKDLLASLSCGTRCKSVTWKVLELLWMSRRMKLRNVA
jgi:hypothetical protein